MISMTKFKEHFWAIFRLMKQTGMYIDVQNRGHVYRIYIEDQKRTVNFRREAKSYTEAIHTGKCTECKKLVMNGVCMNSDCIKNK